MDILLRKGVKEDLPQVLALIKELAEYENALDQVKVTLDQLEKDGFEDHPYYYLLVAEHENQIIGVCFYFIRYSTWKGKVLFLEDFVVKEGYRRHAFIEDMERVLDWSTKFLFDGISSIRIETNLSNKENSFYWILVQFLI